MPIPNRQGNFIYCGTGLRLFFQFSAVDQAGNSNLDCNTLTQEEVAKVRRGHAEFLVSEARNLTWN